MKRFVVRVVVSVAIIAGLSVGVMAGPAFGDAAQNGNNCAGYFGSLLTPPGLGDVLSPLATSAPHALPSTFNLANCGDNGRSNGEPF